MDVPGLNERMARSCRNLGRSGLVACALSGLREVRDNCEADVAAGEYGYSLDYFARMVGADAIDCLQADGNQSRRFRSDPLGGLTKPPRRLRADVPLDRGGRSSPRGVAG